MTTITPTLSVYPSSISRPDTSRPIGPDVVRSEWVKLRTVRSTIWTVVSAAAGMVGIGALVCALYVNRYSSLSAADRASFHPIGFSLNGLFFAQLAIGVLGVLVMTGEYSTGMIRATFAATPQRRVVLAAKAAVLTVVTAVVGIITSFAAFFVGQAILSTKGIEAHIGDPGALRAVVGAGLYLSVLALLSLGLGALIRHSAGAISALFGIVFVLPAIVSTLPGSWDRAISKFLPSNAGQAIIGTARGSTTLSPWVGFAVFCGYAAALLIAAAVVLTRRDA